MQSTWLQQESHRHANTLNARQETRFRPRLTPRPASAGAAVRFARTQSGRRPDPFAGHPPSAGSSPRRPGHAHLSGGRHSPSSLGEKRVDEQSRRYTDGVVLSGNADNASVINVPTCESKSREQTPPGGYSRRAELPGVHLEPFQQDFGPTEAGLVPPASLDL